MSESSPYELIVTYKNPASIDRFDLRNTTVSPLYGTKTPASLSSHLLHFPNESYIISMHPFLTEVIFLAYFHKQDEFLITLSSGDITVLNKTNGKDRLYTTVNESAELARWDGIISKPFRSQLIQESLYIPSIVKRSNQLSLFDFDAITEVV